MDDLCQFANIQYITKQLINILFSKSDGFIELGEATPSNVLLIIYLNCLCTNTMCRQCISKSCHA